MNTTSGVPWLTVLALLPALGAVVVLLTSSAAAKVVALVTSLVTVVLAVVLTVSLHAGGGLQLSEDAIWIRPLGAHYALGLDGIGATLVLLASIVTPVVVLATWSDYDRVPVAAKAHHDPDRGAGALRQQDLLRPRARRADLRALPVPLDRRLPLLRLLRGHPRPDVLPHRRLRTGGSPLVRGGQVPDLRPARRLRDARLGDRALRRLGRRRQAELPAVRPERADVRDRPGPLAVRRLHVRLRDQGTAGAAALAGCPTRPSSPALVAPR